ncbi:MAG: hypothetical protein DA330_02750 [Nitrososphaera sp.]|nr:hypothetical protein [Nitrososphaera sp.]
MATKQATKPEDGLWPEEIEAIKNIKSGKTKMITQDADEFLADMRRLINENKKRKALEMLGVSC